MSFIKVWLLRALPESFVHRLRAVRKHRKKHGRMPRLFFPRTFNDKLLHRILFDRRPILAQVADKAEVRQYVVSRLGPEVLPRLYHLTSDPETISLAELPDQFVVKPTHGSGWVRIVRDRAKVDRSELIETCNTWMQQNYYLEGYEWAYKHIVPRILIEELIDDGQPGLPVNYKFLVFDGVARLVSVHSHRAAEQTRAFYSRDWQRIDVRWGLPQTGYDPARPPHLAEMIDAAERLGHDFDFVRVDFYDTPDRMYFSELTTAPSNGWFPFEPPEFDDHLGSLWKLPHLADLLRGRGPDRPAPRTS